MPLEEQKKSRLYALKPLTDRLPAVSRPEGHVQFRTKMFWVLAILILYFAMTNIFIYGLDRTNVIDFFSSLRAILAGAQGSLMHLGIGPIVTASIIMQLFAGAKIINLNLQDDEDKSVYQGTQKFLVIVMIFVEAIPQVFGFLTPAGGCVSCLNGSLLCGRISAGHGDVLAKFLSVLQLFGGSYLVFLMDEVVSKWGIGSGISLFIAGGVAKQIFTGTFNWEPARAGSAVPAGTIPKTVYYLQHYSASQLAQGGIEQIMVQPPNPLIALIGTVAIFFIVAYVESTRIELPLAHGMPRGARGRYPIRLMYASNIPVILVAAVLPHPSMFSLLFWQHPEWPIVGHATWIGAYPDATDNRVISGQIQRTTPIGGLAYYFSNVNGVQDWLLPLFNPNSYGVYLRGLEYWQVFVHLLVFLGVFIGGFLQFSHVWVLKRNNGAGGVVGRNPCGRGQHSRFPRGSPAPLPGFGAANSGGGGTFAV